MKVDWWKVIVGYEGLYWLSSLGRVKNRYGKILKPFSDQRGYEMVGLCKNGKVKMFRIHRLVAEAFIPNPNNLPEINHKNEIKTDNRVENLEWCSREYNVNYGSRNERVSKKLSTPILQYDLQGNLIKEWTSMIEAERNGFIHGNISLCCRGKQKTHKGYIWKYKE